MPQPRSHPSRRRLLIAGLAAPAWVAAAPALRPAAAITEGPFYPPASWRASQADWDADLTEVRRGPTVLRAQGEHLALELRVVDRQGRPLDGTAVEIWQCDALAAYRHPSASAEPGRFDPDFQGFGQARTGADATAAFRTIRPVPYPGRTPHIHVKLRHPAFGELTSQIFVAGERGNDADFLWRQLGAADRQALAFNLAPASDKGLRWQARHTLVVPA